MSSFVRAWRAYKERLRVENWWRELLTPDTVVDPPLAFVDTDELDFDDIPTAEFDWKK